MWVTDILRWYKSDEIRTVESDFVWGQKHCVTSSAGGWKIVFGPGTKLIIQSSE